MNTRRIASWVALAVVLVVLSVGVALAFGAGNADGVWWRPNVAWGVDGGGAVCDGWASMTGTDFPWSTTDLSIQSSGGYLTDENQVRYGRPVNESSCPSSREDFLKQSGFGFDGENDLGNLDLENPFLLGVFTHYNNPIYDDTPAFNFAELRLTVSDIVCGDGETAAVPADLVIDYRFTLDETINLPQGDDCGNFVDLPTWYSGRTDSAYCKYGPGDLGWPGGSRCPYQAGDTGPNSNGCGDLVDVEISGAGFAEFDCPEGTYTVEILGFTYPEPDTGECVEPTTFRRYFYTTEETDEAACLWAQIIEPTAVDLISFTATGEKRAIVLSWETASETDNLGFNLYRAETIGGERTRLNADLIPPNLPPGSPFGALYEYVDAPVRVSRTYFYWLEDVDVYGETQLYGPVEASTAPRPGLKDLGRGLVPIAEETEAEGTVH